MAHTIAEIAAAIGAPFDGDGSLLIEGAAEPAQAAADHLALATNPKYAEGLPQGQARAALLWPGADWRGLGLQAAIFAPRGRLAMAGLTRTLDAGPHIAPGVHRMSLVEGAMIAEGAAIGPFVSIGVGAVIGPRARIASHVSIGAGAVIGEDALILEGVKIGARVQIGDRVILQPGCVIGADGFSFVTSDTSGVEEIRTTLGIRGEIRKQQWHRIHSLGAVILGDDVEVGANSCIDRGTVRSTSVGHRTKIDNLVHIGHNVEVGTDCLLCGMTGIAGSTRIGDRVVLAGQVGVGDNLNVGDDVIAGAASKILSSVPAGRVILGYPAVKMDTHIAMQKAMRRLPRLSTRLAGIEARLGAPEGGTSEDAE
jgi:UDP-3-O-[3-hydroxymyristoyl] glucosamine N-acyltransferase